MGKRKAPPPAKRRRGDGELFVREDGCLVARLTIGRTERGNPKRKTRVFPKGTDPRVGDDWLDDQRARYKTLVNASADELTVAKYLRQWISFKEGRREVGTVKSYRDTIENYIVPTVGEKVLSKLEPLDVERMQQALAARVRVDAKGREHRLGPRTVAYARWVLASALKQAVRWRLLPYNPADAVDPPRVASGPKVVLARNAAQAFLAAARNERTYALWLLALTTGMRRGELIGLRWQDVDLERATITVSNTVVFPGKPVAKGPKTEGSARTVAIDAATVAALRERKVAYDYERAYALKEKLPWQESGLVFGSKYGTPIYESTLRRVNTRILEAAGLPHIGTHGLRRSYISLAAQYGLDVKVVSERVGHATTRMTRDVYQQTFPEMHRAAALSAEDLFGIRTIDADESCATVVPPSGGTKKDAAD
jgi:integrase